MAVWIVPVYRCDSGIGTGGIGAMEPDLDVNTLCWIIVLPKGSSHEDGLIRYSTEKSNSEIAN